MPEVLRVINWIDFTGSDTGKPFAELIQELDLDREYAHHHTILQQRALEWKESDQTADFLLNNTATQNALRWLEEAAGKNPAPTDRQRQHIRTSQEAVEAAQRAARKRQQLIIAVVSIAAVLSLGFGIFGFVKMNEANKNSTDLEAKTEQLAEQTQRAEQKAAEAEAALKQFEEEQAARRKLEFGTLFERSKTVIQAWICPSNLRQKMQEITKEYPNNPNFQKTLDDLDKMIANFKLYK